VGRYTIEFVLYNSKGYRISWGAANPIQNTYFDKEDTHYVCKLGPLPLTTGIYSFTFVVRIWGMERWDMWEDAISFEINQCDMFKTGFEITSGEAEFMINQQWEARNV